MSQKSSEKVRKSDQILSMNDVIKRIGLSRSTIIRLEQAGRFPAHRIIGLRKIGWVEYEISDWIRTRPTK